MKVNPHVWFLLNCIATLQNGGPLFFTTRTMTLHFGLLSCTYNIDPEAL